MLKPIGKRCLIAPYIAANQTASGIIMENSSNTSNAPVRGTVIEAGNTSQFTKSDEVYFRRYSVESLKTITEKGEQEVMVIDDEDILLLVKPD